MPLNPFRASRNRTTTVCAIAFFAICVWFTAWQEPLLEQRGFVFALMLCVFGAALFVFARLAFALVLSGGLFLLLRAITVLKEEYLESPLMPECLLSPSILMGTIRMVFTIRIGLW